MLVKWVLAVRVVDWFNTPTRVNRTMKKNED
jgi:hypothetical protein